MSAMREMLLREYHDVQRGTHRLLKLIPPGRYDWSPAPGMMTLRDLTGHLAVIARFGVRGLVTGQWEMPSAPDDIDKDSAQLELDKTIAEVVTTIEDISDAEFEKRVIRMPWDHEMTIARAFAAAIEHDIHHRTQLYIYLKMLDVELNSLTLFG